MRNIQQLLMHDSATQLFAFGTGWKEFHSERFTLGSDLRDWVQKNMNPYRTPLPDFDHPIIERAYELVGEDGDFEVTEALGEVIASGTIDLVVNCKGKSGNEWTEHITYCGHFTVWWSE